MLAMPVAIWRDWSNREELPTISSRIWFRRCRIVDKEYKEYKE